MNKLLNNIKMPLKRNCSLFLFSSEKILWTAAKKIMKKIHKTERITELNKMYLNLTKWT